MNDSCMSKGTSGNGLNSEGVRALLMAAIEQAVTDFKELAAAGRIVGDRVAAGNGHGPRGYRNDAETRALVDFFNSPVMDEWIFQAQIPINPDFIREKLGLERRHYEIYDS